MPTMLTVQQERRRWITKFGPPARCCPMCTFRTATVSPIGTGRLARGSIMWHSVFGALAELPDMPRLLLELREAADLLPSAKWLAEVGLAD